MLSLERIIKLPGAEDGRWIRCPLVKSNSFEVLVRHLNPASWDETKAKVGESEADRTLRILADRVIGDWRGLSSAGLVELFPGMSDAAVAEIPSTGIPPTPEARLTILKHQEAFFVWLYRLARDRRAWVDASSTPGL